MINKCRFNQPGGNCQDNSDCSSKFCQLNSGAPDFKKCSQRITGPCSTSEDCSGKGCSNGQCVKCTNDDDCKYREGTPKCKVSIGRCTS